MQTHQDDMTKNTISGKVKSLDSWQKCIFCGSTTKHAPERIFHRFPKDQKRSQLWAVNSRSNTVSAMPPDVRHKSLRVCSSHFSPDDYSGPKRLKINAVPAIFDISKVVAGRWRSLKDAFAKSVKCTNMGNQDGKKRRKEYYYHKQMKFLLPFMKHRRTSGEGSGDEENTVEEKEQTVQPTTSTQSNESRPEMSSTSANRRGDARDLPTSEDIQSFGIQDQTVNQENSRLHLSGTWEAYNQTGIANFSTETDSSSEVIYMISPKRQKISEDLCYRNSLSEPVGQGQDIPDVKPRIVNVKTCSVGMEEASCKNTSSTSQNIYDVQPRFGNGTYSRNQGLFPPAQVPFSPAFENGTCSAGMAETSDKSTNTNSQSENDADKLFLMSLLPNINKLSDLQKLDFKMKVMQLLMSYASSPGNMS